MFNSSFAAAPPPKIGSDTGALTFVPANLAAAVGNLYNPTAGGIYLKTGVVVTRTAAMAAGWNVRRLEQLALTTAEISAPTGALSIAFGAGVFVRVGSVGAVATSPDGYAWTARASGTANALTMVKFLNGLFVAIGTNNVISSPDGVTWTARTNPVVAAKSGLAYIMGRYVITASGTSGTWTASDVLATWTQSPLVTTLSNSLFTANGVILASGTTAAEGVRYYDANGIPRRVFGSTASTFSFCYGGGRYIALGNTTAGAYSADGLTWTGMTALGTVAAKPDNIAYGAGKFVAPSGGSGVQYSVDGIAWTAAGPAASFSKIKFLNGALFVGYTTANAIYTSPDGVTWTLRTTTSTQLHDLTFGGGMYVAVGGDGVDCYTWSSPDAITWTPRLGAGSGSTWIDTITYGNGYFVGNCNNDSTATSICYSANGTAWSFANIPNWTNGCAVVRFLNGSFIAGQSNESGGTGIHIAYAAVPTAWTDVVLNGSNNGNTTRIALDFLYANGSYYFAWSGQGNYSGLARAASISSWPFLSGGSTGTGTYQNSGLASNGSALVASWTGQTILGNNLLASGDGILWTCVPTPSGMAAGAFISPNCVEGDAATGRFYGVASDGYILTSVDGYTWTRNLPGITVSSGTAAGTALAANVGTFVVACGAGTYVTTRDFVTYVARSSTSAVLMNAMTYGAAAFVGVSATDTQLTQDGNTGCVGMGASVTLAGVVAYVKVN